MTQKPAEKGAGEVILPQTVSADTISDGCDQKGDSLRVCSHTNFEAVPSQQGETDAVLSVCEPQNSPPEEPVSGHHRPDSTPILVRILLGASGLFLIAGFVLARSLEPAPGGYGTHQQLGLPPCSIQFLFGIPCPSCGMTTSFAWFTRGQIVRSWQANPAGLYLAILCVLLIPWTLRSSLKTNLGSRRRLTKQAVLLLLPLVILAGGFWLVRLWF